MVSPGRQSRLVSGRAKPIVEIGKVQPLIVRTFLDCMFAQPSPLGDRLTQRAPLECCSNHQLSEDTH